jgi:hypothetical protein
MVNLPHGPLGGVRVEDGLGAGSLILTPSACLPMTFLSFFRGGSVVVALCLPAQVLDDPALGPADESLVDSALRARAKIGTTGISSSPSKPRIDEVKLSRVCTIAYAENEYSRNNLRLNEVLPLPNPFLF